VLRHCGCRGEYRRLRVVVDGACRNIRKDDLSNRTIGISCTFVDLCGNDAPSY
jgi:hypothetical protein